jgi:exodeoxyribonuclease VII small subunit
MTDISALSFERAYEELEAVIAKLESGELALEESVTLYERGKQLSARCQTLLDNAELRIQKLSDDGKLTTL